MAKKTLEARLRMIDETSQGARAAVSSAQAVTNAYSNLDKAARRAQLRILDERDTANRTLTRQKISNLEREVALGRQGAVVDLERARATATFRKEREALLAITRSELTTFRQKVAAYRELERAEKLHGQRIVQMGRPEAGRGGMTMGRLGALAVSYAGARTVGEVGSNIGQARDDVVAFERSLKDLLTTGANSSNIDGVRKKVLDLATAMGRTKEEVAELMFFIEGGTAGMSGKIVQDIQSSVLKTGKLTNSNLSSMAEALIKSYRIFGKEVGNVDEMADKMFATVERGMLTHQDMATFVVQVLSAGDAFKFKLDELLAAVSVSTKSAGDAQQAMTAIRNIVLRLNNAEKEGIKLTGDFVSQLEQLANIDPNKLTDMFGDRTVAVLFDLVRRTKELREEVGILGDVAGTVDRKVQDLGRNGTHAMASMIAAMQMGRSNAIQGLAGEETGRLMGRFEASKLASEKGMFALAPEWMKNLMGMAHVGLRTPQSGRGFAQLAEQMLNAGDTIGARNALGEARRAGGAGDEVEVLQKRLDAIAEYEYQQGVKAMRAAREKAVTDNLNRQTRMGLAGLALEGLGSPGRLPTAAEEAAIVAAGGSEKALKDVQRKAAAAARSGRSFDEQQAFESSFMSLLTGVMKKGFERTGGNDSMVSQWSKAIFGEGNQSFVDKLLGRDKKKSTLMPMLGNMLRDGALGLLGEGNAGFLGFGGKGKKSKAQEAAEKEEDQYPTAGTLLSNSGYMGMAEQAKRQAEMIEVMARVEKNTAAALAALAEVAGALTGVRVLSFNPDS